MANTALTVPARQVGAATEELRGISDFWLSMRNAREKRFSVGFFSADYLMTGPVAVVRRDERIVAFANLWLGSGQQECSVDLMRYGRDAPHGTMDFLVRGPLFHLDAQRRAPATSSAVNQIWVNPDCGLKTRQWE